MRRTGRERCLLCRQEWDVTGGRGRTAPPHHVIRVVLERPKKRGDYYTRAQRVGAVCEDCLPWLLEVFPELSRWVRGLIRGEWSIRGGAPSVVRVAGAPDAPEEGDAGRDPEPHGGRRS